MVSPAGAARSYLDVIAAVVLGVLIFGPTAFRADVSGLIGVAALVIVACSLATASVRMRLWSSVAAGVGTGLLFVVNVPVWLSTVTLASLGYAGVAALADWRGIRRDVRTLLAGLGLFVAFACAALVPSAIGAAVVGTTSLLLGDLRYAMPADASIGLAWAALVVLTLVLALDGSREQRPDAGPVRTMLLSLTCVALLARLVWIASVVTIPSQAFWFDGPFLVNALKLRAHVPLYGPLRELNSYTYSPLIDLVHHALLAPLRLDLSIFAHRALILADQVVAAIVLVWATRPYVDRRDVPWLAAALGLTAFASLVAPGNSPGSSDARLSGRGVRAARIGRSLAPIAVVSRCRRSGGPRGGLQALGARDWRGPAARVSPRAPLASGCRRGALVFARAGHDPSLRRAAGRLRHVRDPDPGGGPHRLAAPVAATAIALRAVCDGGDRLRVLDATIEQLVTGARPARARAGRGAHGRGQRLHSPRFPQGIGA